MMSSYDGEIQRLGDLLDGHTNGDHGDYSPQYIAKFIIDNYQSTIQASGSAEWPERLVSRLDYESLPGVVLARDCWYGKGTIVLLMQDRTLVRLVADFVREHKAPHLIVHIESVHGYDKLHWTIGGD
jgi:hypothetical protein